jgi:hypothetical protein
VSVRPNCARTPSIEKKLPLTISVLTRSTASLLLIRQVEIADGRKFGERSGLRFQAVIQVVFKDFLSEKWAFHPERHEMLGIFNRQLFEK